MNKSILYDGCDESCEAKAVPRLFYCLDAWTGVFYDMTLIDVLDYFHISDIFRSFFETEVPKIVEYVYGASAKFVFNNIMIEFPLYSFKAAIESDIDWIESFKYPHIRVAMMGKGLIYLRSIGIDVDSILRVKCAFLKVTRVDFAYDFFNYNAGLLDSLDSFTRATNCLTPKKRISVRGHKSGIGFTKRIGATEMTIYLGTPQSDRVLRIYDKKLERIAAGNGIMVDAPYGLTVDQISEWVRVEWQLRNDKAAEMLYSSTADDAGFMGVLREIGTFYDILYADRGTSYGVWKRYFSVESLQKLVVLKANLA